MLRLPIDWGFKPRWGSAWVGAHWSPYNKRLCVNLPPLLHGLAHLGRREGTAMMFPPHPEMTLVVVAVVKPDGRQTVSSVGLKDYSKFEGDPEVRKHYIDQLVGDIIKYGPKDASEGIAA